jgi:DNA-binding IclR family transcriptional regulator
MTAIVRKTARHAVGMVIIRLGGRFVIYLNTTYITHPTMSNIAKHTTATINRSIRQTPYLWFIASPPSGKPVSFTVSA